MNVELMNEEAVRHAYKYIIETAGRTCYNKECTGDEDFIRRLIKSGHESVIEHGVATFWINGISRACSHQLVRHRLASYSQRSQRYVNESEADYVTPPEIQKDDYRRMVYTNFMNRAWEVYGQLLGTGVPKEDARYVLPNACTTEIVMTMNFRELRHFLKLRLAKNAQWEIQTLAKIIRDIMLGVAPAIVEDLC